MFFCTFCMSLDANIVYQFVYTTTSHLNTHVGDVDPFGRVQRKQV